MTKKEELLSIKTYEEFDRRRNEFRHLEPDEDIKKHIWGLFPKAKKKPDPMAEAFPLVKKMD